MLNRCSRLLREPFYWGVSLTINLENAVELDCDRLLLETGRFFLKNGLTVVVATAFAQFLEINLHFQRIRRSGYGFNCVFRVTLVGHYRLTGVGPWLGWRGLGRL